MRGFAILLNIFVPGIGSFVVGAAGQGVGQIVVWGVGLLLTVPTLGIGGIIGIPMMLGAWIWGIVTAAGAMPQTVNVTVNNGEPRAPATRDDQ